MKTVVMGIGNTFRKDDGIGPWIIERLGDKNLSESHYFTIDAGTVPENYASVIKRENPDTLIIIDAADMDLQPGEIRIISREKIPELSVSTHGMPLSIFLDYISDFVGKSIVIGIQPAVVEFGEGITPIVTKSAGNIIDAIITNTFNFDTI